LHGADEAVAPLGNGLNQRVNAVAIGEHPAEVGDVVNKVMFLDKCVGPNLAEQVLLRHQLALPLQERGQDLYGFGSKGDHIAIAIEDVALGLEAKGTEYVVHTFSPQELYVFLRTLKRLSE
jgi:hypothetical protein